MIESSYNESDPPIYRVVIISIQKGTHSFECLLLTKKTSFRGLHSFILEFTFF